MYTVVIVDDENIIRYGIKKTLENMGSKNFEVIGTAKDGVEGLNLIVKLRPDIVLSDIKMPKMTGIKMIEEARKLSIYPKVIFLSGYDEFQFAKAALDLKAETYLLKPILPVNLINILNDITKRISEENMLKQQMDQNISILKHNFIGDLLSRPPFQSDEDFINEFKFYDINIFSKDFLVLIINIDDYHDECYSKEILENEICKYAIVNISTELLSDQFNVIPYYSDGDKFQLILNNQSAETSMLKVYDICYDISEKVQQYLKTTITIGIGNWQSGFSGIFKSFNDAKNVLDYRHILGKNRIITSDDLKMLDTGEPENINADNHFEDELILEIKLGRKDMAREIVYKIQNILLKDRSISLSEIQIIAIKILAVTLKEISNWSVDNTQILQKYFHSVSAKVYLQNTIFEIFDLLVKTINEIVSVISNDPDNQQKKIVEQAIAYIMNNYRIESLSLTEIAQHIHISPSYLSTIFKKETNENFVEYLTKVRMEKAKIIIKNKSLKAYEVANAVGYSNPQYFSLCFKKYTGYSPMQYRSIK